MSLFWSLDFPLGWNRATVGMVLEILILTLCFYAVLRFLRSTRGSGVLSGLIYFLAALFVFLQILSNYPGVPVIQEILDRVGGLGLLVVAVLFQPELRQGISRFGTGFFSLMRLGRASQKEETLAKLAAAAQRMAKERIGALIAIERNVSLTPFYENAVGIDAPVSAILLETIFFPGSPLHDGAVIVQEDRLIAAACLFPLTENPEVQRRMGTRHRAALGLTEETDAVTLVVSEETGQISLCAGGRIYRRVPFDSLEERLLELLRSKTPTPKPKKRESTDELSESTVIDATQIQAASRTKEAATS